MQGDGDVNGADISDILEVRDAGAFQLCGCRGVTHVYPADSLLSIDEVHSHGLFGGNRGQSRHGATQGGAADVMEVSDQQHRQAIHRLWGRRSGRLRKSKGERGQHKREGT